MTMTSTARARYGAVCVALAPVVMFVALVAHPYLMRLPDATGVAEAVEQNTTRWAIVHLLTAVGVALIALAFLAIRARLRDAGEDRYSAWALPLVLSGSALYGLLPGLEFALIGAVLNGDDAAGIQSRLQPWFVAILAGGGLLFAVGVYGFARAVAASQLLSRPLTWLIVVALVALAVSRLVPLGAVQFYAQAVVGIVALWPLAYQMWQAPQATPVGSGRATATRHAPRVS